MSLICRLSGKTPDEEAALKRPRKVELFPCSFMRGTGYGAGLRWMAQYRDRQKGVAVC